MRLIWLLDFLGAETLDMAQTTGPISVHDSDADAHNE
jgi:hypothetical protein